MTEYSTNGHVNGTATIIDTPPGFPPFYVEEDWRYWDDDKREEVFTHYLQGTPAQILLINPYFAYARDIYAHDKRRWGRLVASLRGADI